MDSSLLRQALTFIITEKHDGRFTENEVRQSIIQVASRWCYVLDYHEKKAIARQLGGNKYTLTAYEILDAIMKDLVEGTDE